MGDLILILFFFGSIIFLLAIQRIVNKMNDILKELNKLNKRLEDGI